MDAIARKAARVACADGGRWRSADLRPKFADFSSPCKSWAGGELVYARQEFGRIFRSAYVWVRGLLIRSSTMEWASKWDRYRRTNRSADAVRGHLSNNCSNGMKKSRQWCRMVRYGASNLDCRVKTRVGGPGVVRGRPLGSAWRPSPDYSPRIARITQRGHGPQPDFLTADGTDLHG